MKIGAFTSLYHDLDLNTALGYLATVGFQAVELYCGALIEPSHCDPNVLLNDKNALEAFKDTFRRHDMQLSILNCSGNPVSPDPAVAKRHDDAFHKAVLLAEKLDIHGVVTFSGCPGGGPRDETPNWITCPWPDEFAGMLEYQWNEVLIPYWQRAARFAADHGVDKIALEMHPGFCVYNPETLLKLRAAVGPAIGSNFDPSHLFWQGIDPALAIRQLGEAVFHVHAKDTRVFAHNTAVNGVLDTKHYGALKDRAWVFGTVGYGHGAQTWRKIIDALGVIGYDYVISIEHEDSLMGKNEGLEKAFAFLRDIVIKEKPGEMWWA